MNNIEQLTVQNLSDTPQHRAGSLLRRAAAECARVGAPATLEFTLYDRHFSLNWTYSTTTLRWVEDEVGHSVSINISGDNAYKIVGNGLARDDADYTSPPFTFALAALEWLLMEKQVEVHPSR